MPIRTTCPGCQVSYSLPDNLEGKKVRCKKCQQTFLVGAIAETQAEEPEEDQEAEPPDREPPDPRLSRSPARRRSAADEDDEEEEDEEEPRPSRSPARRRPADEDDEDTPRPRRKFRKKKSQAFPAWVIGVVGAGLVLMVLVGIGAVVGYFKARKALEVAQAQVPPPVMTSPAQAPTNNPARPPDSAMSALPPAAGPVPPSSNPTPQPQPAAQMTVELSNGKIGRGIGLHKVYSVDYRFVQGGPDFGSTYLLVIKSPRGEASARLSPIQIRNQGHLAFEELGFGNLNDPGPFEAYMQISQGIGGPFDARQVISNTIPLQP